MAVIISTKQLPTLSKELHAAQKRIVLAGGCFDVIHPGHIMFLIKAKEKGDVLLLLLESDERIRAVKGKNRPIHTQKERAYVLAAISSVDYIVPLGNIPTNDSYDRLAFTVKPAIIANTVGDPARSHKERQARLTGARVVSVTKQLHGHSTTRVADLLEKEL